MPASLGRGFHHPGQLELHQHHVRHRMHGGALRLDHEVRGLPVQRFTLGQQLAHSREHIGALQQRPPLIVPHAARQLFGRGPQVHHRAAMVQVLAVVGPQHRATTRGNHCSIVSCSDFVDHLRLDLPKRRFALVLEVHADRAADTLLDQVISVDKRPVQLPRQLPADGGFAGAGEADKRNGQIYNG
jgi:hypothetical protein